MAHGSARRLDDTQALRSCEVIGELPKTVILSEAKDLCISFDSATYEQLQRSFASLRMTIVRLSPSF